MNFRIDSLRASMTTLMLMETDVMEIKKFLERELPLLNHYQLCEGLSKTCFTDASKAAIHQFEKEKLTELVSHCESMDLRMPRLKIYRGQIQGFGKYCKEMDTGVVPFTFTPEGDWWEGTKEVDASKMFKVAEFNSKSTSIDRQVNKFKQVIENDTREMIQEYMEMMAENKDDSVLDDEVLAENSKSKSKGKGSITGPGGIGSISSENVGM